MKIESLAAEKIAKEFGTPLYCYSATRIEENYLAYDRAFSMVLGKGQYTICYACKANSNVAIIALLQKLGAGADIVSGGEMQRALAAKIPAKKIVYSGVGKNEQELTAAVQKGLMQINVESENELQMIAKIAKRLKKTVNVGLRVNPDVDAKTHAKITTGKKENKFGIEIADARAFYKAAAKLAYINPCGVAVHIGSQLTSLAPFKSAYGRIAKLVKALRADGHDITQVDLGGGIGIRYKDETPPDLYLYALMIRDTIGALDVHIILEPGRSIVGDAGVLLSRVMQIKKGKTKSFAIIDAAMNDLVRPAMYDAYHAVIPCTPRKGAKRNYDVVGPICETGDTFLKNEKISPLEQGDLVAIMTAGAYGAVMASNYNTRPFGGEVLVRGKKSALIRKPQTVSDLIKRDIIPKWI